MPPPWSGAERELRIASGEYDEYFEVDPAGVATLNQSGGWLPVNSVGVVIPSDAAIGAWCVLTPTGIVLTYGVKFSAVISVSQTSPDSDVQGTEFNGFTFNGEPLNEDGQPWHAFPLDGDGEPITEWPAGTSIDFWGARFVDDGPGEIRLLVRLQIDSSYDPGPPTPPEVGGENGIYVGSIVLADTGVGIYRYNGEDGPTFTGDFDTFAGAYEDAPWQGSSPGLQYTTGGFTMRRIRANTAGTYFWAVTPLFAVDNDTSRVAVAIYDFVGDFLRYESITYVSSGETVTGGVYLPAGFAMAFVVGDDDSEITQQTLTGSFWQVWTP